METNASYTKIFIKNNIRIYVSDMTNITNKILSYHKYLPLPSLIIANSIAAFSPLKFLYESNNLLVRIKTNGAMNSLIFEIKDNSIRTLISNPNIATEYDKEKFNSIPIILGIGDDGTFEVSREIKGEYFTSKTKLAKYDIVTDLAYFLNKSDQIYSAVVNDVELDQKNPRIAKRSRNLFFQLLPEHGEEDKIWIENFISSNDFKNLSIEKIIEKIDGKELFIGNLNANCWCEKNKIVNAINLLTLKERKELFKSDKNVEVICEFCKVKHIVNREEINE